jgi:hypothetical protein
MDEATRERHRQAVRRWRERNPEKHREHVRKWKAANPELVREQDRRKARKLAAKGPRRRTTSTPCLNCGGTNRMPSGHCRPCHAEANRLRALKHPEKVKQENRAKSQRWRDRKSPDEKREYALRGNMSKMLREMGLSREQYGQMVVDQNNRCAICGDPPNGKRFQRLAVDHCHSSGKVRGLLCASCNLSIGHFDDDVSRLQKAIDYLNKHKDTT